MLYFLWGICYILCGEKDFEGRNKMKQLTFIVMCFLSAAALQAATLPFTETFEINPVTMAGTIGPIDGQHGWVDTSSNAVVQTANTWEFDQAACISNAELSQAFTDGKTNVWTVFAWHPGSGMVDTNELPADTTVVFWVNTSNTLSAYSNQTPIDTGTSVDTSAWSRVQVHSDYSAETWSMWLDGTRLIDQFAFYTNSLPGFSAIRFKADEGSTLYVDDVRIGTAAWNPQPGDTDNDGLDDDWELLYLNSPNILSNGTGNADGDSLTDGEEEIAGSDPTDSNSVFTVSEEGVQTGSGFIIRWASVTNRLYSIDSRSNLLTGTWSNIESNVAATPPLNTYTVQTDSAETLFNRVRVRKQ